MKALRSFETSATIRRSIQRNIPQELNLRHHRCKNPKFRATLNFSMNTFSMELQL